MASEIDRRHPTPQPDAILAPGMTGARPIPPIHVHTVEADPHGKRLAGLTLAALGVVYGDIGTSPLYAFRECFKPEYGLTATPANVYGVLSLILWSIVLVVSVKYIVFILRADNRGEGGILAILALLLQRTHRVEDTRLRKVLVALGLFGAALLYGDGSITPAITVLGAMEGLEVVSSHFAPFVLPGALAIIVALFWFQRFGTTKIGFAFGPIMLVWFVTIAALGVREIALEPEILRAAYPWAGLQLIREHRMLGFLVLGAVVLAVTGAEALYADMGHFGRKPIRLAWFYLAFPALLLNYFGQGALVLRDPAAAVNPFYLLAPASFLLPLVIIATLAAIVASQALISGAFSLTQQSVQLGYSPRVTIRHTHKREAGQIYIPEVNKALAVMCVLLVLGFRSSTALGAAYGIATTITMAITSLLFGFVARTRWQWPMPRVVLLTGLFLIIDLGLFAANIPKIKHGAWVPLLIAASIFLLMTTWKRGRELLRAILDNATVPVDQFLASLAHHMPHRVDGTAVFMTSTQAGAPAVLLHHLKHNKVLHRQVMLLSVVTAEVPETPVSERVKVEPLAHGFFRVTARYGFMQTPDVKEILAFCQKSGIETKPLDTSFYLGRERLLPIGKAKMWRWRKKIFVFMSRNARSATEFFGIPPNRVVELGTQIEF